MLNRSIIAIGISLSALCGTVSAERPSFVRDVMPVLTKAGCNGGKCHGSFQGRGGFRLSLLGFDPAADHESLVNEARGRRVSLTTPDRSLILRKADGAVPHGGGRRFGQADQAWRKLHDWIRAGADSPDTSLTVERLEVQPTDVVVKSGEQVSVNVRAVWSDGRTTDASPWAMYEVRDESLAGISPDGLITVSRPGRTAVTVTFMGQVSAITITVPYRVSSIGSQNAAAEFASDHWIDQLVSAEWTKVGLTPAPLADDATFLRRASLDIAGSLPTPDEVRNFLASDNPEKRRDLVEQLLARPEYVDCWSTKWADLLRVHRRYLGDKGLWSFHGWVRNAVRENWPVDRIARELITSKGSLFTNGATAYYYIDSRPEELAETTSQVFLGIRLQCARCHHHPYEIWSQQDYYGLASFFTRLQIKDNGDGARYGGTKLLRPIAMVPKGRRLKMSAETRAFGHPVDSTQTSDARVELADWITSSDNPWFARNFVNRYWSHFMGRGLVEPVDDLRATNPASHPELLTMLADDFVKNGYDVQRLIRTICRSLVYQLAADVSPQHDRDGMFYAHRTFRRLPAAVLLDAVNQACQTQEEFAGLPNGTRSQALPDPQIDSYFLTAFGRSVRSSPCECSASTSPDLAQALHLINSQAIDQKVSAANGRVDRLLKSDHSDADMIEEMYLATFNRFPSDDERATAVRLIQSADLRKHGFEDLMWTLLNSTSFVFNY